MQPEIQGRDAEAPPRDMLVTCGLSTHNFWQNELS